MPFDEILGRGFLDPRIKFHEDRVHADNGITIYDVDNSGSSRLANETRKLYREQGGSVAEPKIDLETSQPLLKKAEELSELMKDSEPPTVKEVRQSPSFTDVINLMVEEDLKYTARTSHIVEEIIKKINPSSNKDLGVCINCGNPKPKNKAFCSKECFKTWKTNNPNNGRVK